MSKMMPAEAANDFFLLISGERSMICGWLQAVLAKEPSEIEGDKSQDHTHKQNMFQWTCDLQTAEAVKFVLKTKTRNSKNDILL